ncbi:EamA family transporter RarD [Ferrimonas sediminicola]|uniref:EamA family transporter RarD n=1 Tax=Ferrimonas sediminicola TaxID=2569538 RepID=A0A4U1BIC7_9GAMM|nr:EamA family transporter RarD [Ferrimonas sediminicola]TKB51089.1 EamA family transporter RarD [Ferrimonas sediminicola]
MQNQEMRQGIIYALMAYSMWGFAPLYFKAIAEVPATEILMHRVIWSFALMALLVAVTGQMGAVRNLLRTPKQLATLTATAVLVAGNWLIFIWAVNSGRMLEASLGYFINPLVNVALGMLFLGERLPKMQLAAVGMAVVGVALELVQFGSLPWVSLGLATSFGLYGLLRKRVALKSVTGLFVETSLMLPLALLFWWQLDTPTSDLSSNGLQLNLLILAAGVVTTLPLLAFAAAAVRIPFYMLGLFQYIGPSLMFILATTLYGETLDPAMLTTFCFIWAALLIFTLDLWRRSRARAAVA